MLMDSRVRYSLKSEIDVQTQMDMAVVLLSKSVNRHGLAELEEHHVRHISDQADDKASRKAWTSAICKEIPGFRNAHSSYWIFQVSRITPLSINFTQVDLRLHSDFKRTEALPMHVIRSNCARWKPRSGCVITHIGSVYPW